MTIDRAGLRDRLLAMERMNPDIKKRYDEELKKMFEKSISPLRRIGIVVLILVLVVQMIGFSYAAIKHDTLPLLARLGFVAGILFSAAFIVVLASVLKRGSYNLRTHPNAITGITWIFLVIFTTLMLLLSGRVETLKGVQMVVNTTIFFIMGVVFLLKNAVEQSELKTREKLLDIECRLAEIAEKLEKK